MPSLEKTIKAIRRLRFIPAVDFEPRHSLQAAERDSACHIFNIKTVSTSMKIMIIPTKTECLKYCNSEYLFDAQPLRSWT
jgi:hypothetical protein